MKHTPHLKKIKSLPNTRRAMLKQIQQVHLSIPKKFNFTNNLYLS